MPEATDRRRLRSYRLDAAGWAPLAIVVVALGCSPSEMLLCHCTFDAPPRDESAACSPLLQNGCVPGDKCTWIIDQSEPLIGHLACAADGSIPVGGLCQRATLGPLGADDCVRGSICVEDACRQICDVEGSLGPGCAEDHACVRRAEVFEVGGLVLAGVCEPACDPLTQDVRLPFGSRTAACGSSNPSAPTRGCYGVEAYSCAPTDPDVLARTDRALPLTNTAGNALLNGCAPGFIPLLFEGTGSTTTLCTGLCAALETDNTPANAGHSLGDPTALAKNPTDAVAMPGRATCSAANRGSDTAGPSSCRFLWPFVVDESTGQLPPAFDVSSLRDTLGMCLSYEQFMYDADGNTIPDTVFPPCETLPRTGVTKFDNAAAWGCLKRANTTTAINAALRGVRFAHERSVLEKHVLR